MQNTDIIHVVIDTLLCTSNMCCDSAYMNKKSHQKSNLKRIRENAWIENRNARPSKRFFILESGIDQCYGNFLICDMTVYGNLPLGFRIHPSTPMNTKTGSLFSSYISIKIDAFSIQWNWSFMGIFFMKYYRGVHF